VSDVPCPTCSTVDRDDAVLPAWVSNVDGTVTGDPGTLYRVLYRVREEPQT
jgi:hypothetical protein